MLNDANRLSETETAEMMNRPQMKLTRTMGKRRTESSSNPINRHLDKYRDFHLQCSVALHPVYRRSKESRCGSI